MDIYKYYSSIVWMSESFLFAYYLSLGAQEEYVTYLPFTTPYHLLLTFFYTDLCSRWLTCRDTLTTILAFCVWLDPANRDPSRGSEEGKNEAMVFIPSALSLWSWPRLSPLLKAIAFARWPFSHRPVVLLAPLASVVALLLQADMAKDPSFWP